MVQFYKDGRYTRMKTRTSKVVFLFFFFFFFLFGISWLRGSEAWTRVIKASVLCVKMLKEESFFQSL